MVQLQNLWEIYLEIKKKKLFCSEYVLDISEGFHDMGGIRWQLALSLLGAWILVGICLIRGIKSQGKVGKTTLENLPIVNM